MSNEETQTWTLIPNYTIKLFDKELVVYSTHDGEEVPLFRAKPTEEGLDQAWMFMVLNGRLKKAYKKVR